MLDFFNTYKIREAYKNEEFLGFLLFSCVIRQLNEITNLISINADFMRSESQTLHSALYNTSSTFNRYYQIKLNW